MTDYPDCWHDLANAVILQAIGDYREVCRKQALHPYNRKLEREKRSLERFFAARWFRTLTEIDGNELLTMIRKDA